MRTFLAIDLPGEIRSALREVTAPLRERCRGWRWLRPEGIHLTLRFLGEVDEADITRQEATWRRVADATPPMRLDIGGLGVFPPRGRPRILWIGVRETSTTPVLARLASSLEAAARDLGFEIESRPFRPHLTVARALRGERPVAPSADEVDPVGPFEATEVTLVRSELRPEGARYHAVQAFRLGGG